MNTRPLKQQYIDNSILCFLLIFLGHSTVRYQKYKPRAPNRLGMNFSFSCQKWKTCTKCTLRITTTTQTHFLSISANHTDEHMYMHTPVSTISNKHGKSTVLEIHVFLYLLASISIYTPLLITLQHSIKTAYHPKLP